MYGIQFKYPVNNGTVAFLPDVWEKSRIPVDLLCGTDDVEKDASVNSYVSQQSRILKAAYHQVQNRMRLQQDRQKEVYDRRRHGESFKQGDYIYIYILLLSHVAVVGN